MPKEKPSCAEFIVAAIRATRAERKGLKPGTASGRALRFVDALACNFYNEEEFRQGLQELLDNGKALLVAEVSEFGTGKDSFPHLRKISRIPPNVCMDEGWWYLDAHEEPVDTCKVKEYTCFSRLCLYVVEDGLPARIKEFISGGLTVAEQIMASLQGE